jgi:hypothetical protein
MTANTGPKGARDVVRRALVSLTVALACAAAAAGQGAQQTGSAQVPDITGSWERYGFGGGRGGDPQAAALRPPPAPQPLLKPMYMKEWQARVQAAREADAKGQPLATGYTHCLPDGMPSMMAAMFPLEILQSRGQVTIIEEAFTQVRRIHLDRPQKAIADVEPGFFGYSVGKWQGDTLVVDTIGIKEDVRYQNTPHSSQMRITERIKLMSPQVLWNEITIEDPVTLEKPWTVTYAYRRMPDYSLLEYVCEDNREYADEKGVQQIRIGPPK